MSNCVFNFNFLVIEVSEILRVPNYIRGPAPPGRPLAEKIFFVPQGSELFSASNSGFIFFAALVISEILGGPKFTLGGPAPLERPLLEKFLYPKRVLYHV